ncbi:uncharacterized protein LOC141665584 [Apium graveolens]|uniref:uncharacterized protein LOC141665584 n=1 Tax=Apium graveolens TaxID=4045 RepID=UPI003D7914ED
MALRERQTQNLEVDLRIEDIVESSFPNVVEEEVEPVWFTWTTPKNFRGRSKMLKVHGRISGEKVVIKSNKQGQLIGDKKPRQELSNFLGTLVKDHMSLTLVNWHVILEELKKKMLDYTLERFDIPEHGYKWINMTLNIDWRAYKCRVKKDHYLKYKTDEERIEYRPDEIPLDDFKLLMMYWADEEVQALVKGNAARRTSYTDPHTLGRKPLAKVRSKLV